MTALYKTVGTQTDVAAVAGIQPVIHNPDCMEEDADYEDSDQEDQDSDYCPSAQSSDEEYVPPSSEPHEDPVGSTGHAIYLVFWSCLIQLLSTWCSCPSCGSRRLTWTRREFGSQLCVSLTCNEEGCRHSSMWTSQPTLGRIPAGNVYLSAGILFAGASVVKVLRVLSHMNVAAISTRTFFRHQQQLLFPAIKNLWKGQQQWLLSTFQAEGTDLVCGGDGRADSPGHSAKFGTYTMMELRHKAIVDVQLVQVC